MAVAWLVATGRADRGLVGWWNVIVLAALSGHLLIFRALWAR